MNLLWFLPLFTFVYMTLWFLFSLWVKRRDVVDLAWGSGFVFLAWISFSFRDIILDERAYWILLLTPLWGLRLFFHTYHRNLSKEEDWRYHQWRGNKQSRLNKEGRPNRTCRRIVATYFQVFLFQGALMMIIGLPIVYSLCLISLPLFSINYFGIILLLLGLLLETVADWQRYQFLQVKKNANKLITSGLWRFSRHPNYFGEIIFWWGMFFLVLGAPKAWMLMVSPLILTYIMLFVSGLPMEKRHRGRPDFEEYKRHTSALIPWFRKKGE
jgi:steroid 5-alpha reductase family enzyme